LSSSFDVLSIILQKTPINAINAKAAREAASDYYGRFIAATGYR